MCFQFPKGQEHVSVLNLGLRTTKSGSDKNIISQFSWHIMHPTGYFPWEPRKRTGIKAASSVSMHEKPYGRFSANT